MSSDLFFLHVLRQVDTNKQKATQASKIHSQENESFLNGDRRVCPPLGRRADPPAGAAGKAGTTQKGTGSGGLDDLIPLNAFLHYFQASEPRLPKPWLDLGPSPLPSRPLPSQNCPPSPSMSSSWWSLLLPAATFSRAPDLPRQKPRNQVLGPSIPRLGQAGGVV